MEQISKRISQVIGILSGPNGFKLNGLNFTLYKDYTYTFEVKDTPTVNLKLRIKVDPELGDKEIKYIVYELRNKFLSILRPEQLGVTVNVDVTL